MAVFDIHIMELKDLVEDPENPREITERAVKKVASLLVRFGWLQPIVIHNLENKMIKAGHTRKKACQFILDNWGKVIDDFRDFCKRAQDPS